MDGWCEQFRILRVFMYVYVPRVGYGDGSACFRYFRILSDKGIALRLVQGFMEYRYLYVGVDPRRGGCLGSGVRREAVFVIIWLLQTGGWLYMVYGILNFSGFRVCIGLERRWGRVFGQG